MLVMVAILLFKTLTKPPRKPWSTTLLRQSGAVFEIQDTDNDNFATYVQHTHTTLDITFGTCHRRQMLNDLFWELVLIL